MKRGRINSILVVDIEATCWRTKEEQGSKPNEIIEIGCAEYVVKTGEIINRNSIVVKPQFTEVSEFCTELTGWTQEQIDLRGHTIQGALLHIAQLYPNIKHWASYGEYDRWKLSSYHKAGIGKLYGLMSYDNPFEQMQHINVKTQAGLRFNGGQEKGMASMLELLGIPLEGQHHNGADDANNIAKILHRTIIA